jgi:hypothetical protein
MRKIFKIFCLFIFLLGSFFCFSQESNKSIVGIWKVNYFASGNEKTDLFPQNLLMEYRFLSNNDYIYSVTDLQSKSTNEQKGTYQILNDQSILLSVEDIKMKLLVFRFTNQELVFKTEVEGEELFFIMNKY